MEAYIEHMVEEKRELDEKIAKLIAFRYSEKGDELLDDYQRDLLDSQFSAMSHYSNILANRIRNEKIKTGVITPAATKACGVPSYGAAQTQPNCLAQPQGSDPLHP